ncbi:MAG TPA: adenylate/guanylate cyclase domain-containing protein [Stellaceae bacterium]|nr:adenylate/guanylate cyclase domain-containing protein [Stellaceae bacterium]
MRSSNSRNIAPLRRRLTTIVIGDVVGYSRLMSIDEEGTHARVSGLFQQMLEPSVCRRGGILIKTNGDGFLAEFASVVEAVRCALDIQEHVAEENVDATPERKIALRIGINLGDVIAEGDDIFGDGVNVAARLEALATPGSIVVSRSVRDHVRDKLKLCFEDMGEIAVKNIARPVRAFRAVVDSDAIGAHPPRTAVGRRRRIWLASAAVAILISVGGGWWFVRFGSETEPAPTSESVPSASQLSIVVLPFQNLGGDPRQDYFVDGITQSLTTDLSRALPGSFVVARGTAFTYKGKAVDAREVGHDLRVRYVLEGSVTPDKDRVRVNVQLIEADTDIAVWAERFDSRREDLLDIQDQIVGRLSRAVGLKLVDIEARRSERERPVNPTALDLVMRAQTIANRPASAQTMVDARALFQQALDHDPQNADALAGIAMTYVFEVLNGYYGSGREQRLSMAKDLIRRALEIDPRHIVALKLQAAILRAESNFEEAIAASELVVKQNPGEPWAYKEIGLSKLYLGRFEEARQWFEKAEQIGPRDPSRWIWLEAKGRTQFFLGNNEDAIRLMRLSADANPNDPRAYALLAAIYALSGQKDEASSALGACLRIQPNLTITRFFADWSVPLEATSPAYQLQHRRFADGLRLAGMPES